jgi:hypothetical protein
MTPAEVALEEPIFVENGSSLPDPATSVFLGVFRNGQRVAFLVLQLKLHAEPLYVEPGHSAVFAPLVKAAEDYILANAGPQWVYLFAPAGRISQLAASMGMQMEPFVVMSKLVAPPIPSKGPVEFNVPTPPPDDKGEEVIQ